MGAGQYRQGQEAFTKAMYGEPHSPDRERIIDHMLMRLRDSMREAEHLDITQTVDPDTGEQVFHAELRGYVEPPADVREAAAPGPTLQRLTESQERTKAVLAELLWVPVAEAAWGQWNNAQDIKADLKKLRDEVVGEPPPDNPFYR